MLSHSKLSTTPWIRTMMAKSQRQSWSKQLCKSVRIESFSERAPASNMKISVVVPSYTMASSTIPTRHQSTWTFSGRDWAASARHLTTPDMPISKWTSPIKVSILSRALGVTSICNISTFQITRWPHCKIWPISSTWSSSTPATTESRRCLISHPQLTLKWSTTQWTKLKRLKTSASIHT